jgi:two-component system, NtrC family, sensor histidine kinase HydH
MSDKEKENPTGRWPLILPPKYLAGLFVFMIAIFLGTILFEYQYRKSEIEHIMREEAAVLIHALTEGADNAITGYNENSSLLTGSLFNQLRLLDRIDKKTALTSADLTDIAGSGGMYRINIFDRHGRRIAFNTPSDHEPMAQQCDPKQQLQPIFSGQTDSLVIGIRESASQRGPRLVVAIARSRGGAISGNIDASRLIDLRRQLGVGRLIQQIGADTTGIDYIIWQDTTAILAATPNITGAAPLLSDTVLAKALLTRKPTTRLTIFDGRKVFEVLKPFIYHGANVGLLRIGLKTDHLTVALTKLRIRFILLAFLVCFGSLVMLNLVMSRRSEVRMAKACERAQTFSLTILESMADAVIAVNADGCITLINVAAEKLFTLSSRNVLGKEVTLILPECATFFTIIMAEQKTSLHREFECMVTGKNLFLAGNFTLITGSDHGIEGALGVLRDLSEQRSMQRVINRQEKLSAMGELASGVAHEIRNPLNAIGILAQRLAIEFSPTTDEEEYRQLVRAVVSEVYRVNAIIQRFLKFARPSKLIMIKSDLDEFMLTYRHLLQGEADAKGIRFTLNRGSGVMVNIDREQMQQALLNLVQNAVEATEEGGMITISLFCRENQAIIEISDTGRGIPENERAQIFNLYYTTKDEGTGMGLSIANQIIQSHGGIIEIESKEHQGTCFRIKLPLA